MTAEVEYYGIRHHGPGSAQRLVEALEASQPAEVLIEGPADLSELIPMLADRQMVPPVALLAYPKGEPERAIFWPFSVFSPEYQAAVWAAKNQVPTLFIDLPVYWRLRKQDDAAQAADDSNDDDATSPEDTTHDSDNTDETHQASNAEQVSPLADIQRDPIGALAFAAGYEDGESWWQHVIEENPAPGPIFASIADAMRTLREHEPAPEQLEAAREAHMRLEIAKARRRVDGTIAVVCGAWHVPALQEKHTAKDDRALLKGVPKRKVSATWTPWTSPRLAMASGYGAGVRAPGWNRHIWETPRHEQTTRWVARSARALREQGHIVSTASLIETERLAVSLAAIRDRPQPGFEELTDAIVACMCYGNRTQWQAISAGLLVGSEVGEIPDNVPLAPLLEDLQRQQRAARLKPEALPRELSLDLRSESGLLRSTLLHRLNALGVDWGQLNDPGRSRGTFRERWVLTWQPEHAVQLVENLVYGATIAQAAAGRLVAQLPETRGLGPLANLVFAALTAQLPEAAAKVNQALEHRAGQTSDCSEMLSALPPIADVLRYGKARAVDTGQMSALFDRIATQASLALHHASRGLDEEAAEHLRDLIREADRAMLLLDTPATDTWLTALHAVVRDQQATPLVAGQAARLLYEGEHLTTAAAIRLLARRLSPGTTTADAAGYFEGFLQGAGSRLIHDRELRACVSDWIVSLDDETFTESLPLFRRVFSNMDKLERRRLLEAALGKETTQAGLQVSADAATLWPEHLRQITNILTGKQF